MASLTETDSLKQENHRQEGVMKSFPKLPLVATAARIVAVAIVAGCATIPPAKPVTELSSLAGTWQGTVYSRQGGADATTVTIKPDGSGEWSAGPQRGTIKYAIVDGKIRWSSSSGRTGTTTLHEGGGKRVLRSVSDDGSVQAQYELVK
jgi:hypothetical protein